MTAGTYFHVGVLVPQLEDAIDAYASRLGLDFTPPTLSHADDYREYGGPGRSIDVRFAYSRQGPPNYELIEVHDEGLYGRQNGVGLHHVGMWVPDVATSVQEYAEQGIALEAAYYLPDGSIAVAYLEPSGLEGVRLELLNESRRPGLEAWIRGDGDAPTTSA